MKGLIKNNLYGTYANAKVFAGFMILFGVFVVAVISQSLQIGYVMTGIIGFSVSAVLTAKSDFASKWGKYKLTLPVRRADIVRSHFLNQMIWLLVGILFVGIELSLSSLFHGCPFDQPVDILSMFALGISMSLFMGAVFFPLFYAGGAERGEVFLIIAILCAFGLDFTIVSITNELLDAGAGTVILGIIILAGCSLLAFGLSYPLTVCIFRKKEY
ncbi:ABC-2 transporter permease [Parablautia intestinalis]|uniref:ABC-2 transporter permease n=1 Tax=Parablautia intestinalis TaxID=2320100 RepID=A0A3A9AU60_9FIRM|nr:ABC-2 transporter permease [Parablautia intestinalis]RKI91111.1 ABC-2 transporter permease [Parablautia intestinalis]